MKAATQSLKDLLYNNDQHFVATLVTFEFAAGTQRWASFGTSVAYGGNTWSLGPGVEVSEMRSTAGVEVDTCGITLYPDGTTIGGSSLFAAAIGGAFDRVKVSVDRAFMVNPATPVELINEFAGKVSEVRPSTTTIQITARSILDSMTANIPSRMTGLTCPYEVYGTACGVTKATFTYSTTTGASSTASVVNVLNASGANKGGMLTVSGATRTIASVNSLAITLARPLPSAPGSGVAVSIVTGCDRLRATCDDTFNNLLRFGGFPDVPAWAQGE